MRSTWRTSRTACLDAAAGHPHLLWFVLNDANLGATARTLIVDPQDDILLSPATYWQIAIKISIGKYRLPGPFEVFMEQQIALNDFDMLPITYELLS